MRAALLLVVLGALCAACATPVRPPPPVPAAASAALAEARAALRAGDAESAARARAALARARELAPDWVAPRRALDDLDRADLLGLEALAAHRDALRREGEDAATHYLAGRFEGRAGTARFLRATRLDPSLAWAWHGLAVQGGGEDAPPPRRAAERALALARDPFERTTFSSNLARIDAAAGRVSEAVRRLDARAADPEIAPGDRAELAVQAALLELRAPRLHVVESGIERALALLAHADLTATETVELATALGRSIPRADPARVVLSLAARPGALRDRLRAEILLDEAPTPLALGLLERAADANGAAVPRGSLLRAARFAAGDFAGATERWLDELPRVVKGEDGLPREPRLARVVEAARALESRGGVDELQAFCDALLAAGWFREARAVAARLAASDLGRAAAADARALAATSFLSAAQRLLLASDVAERRRRGPPAERDAEGAPVRPAPGPPRALDELFGALAPHAALALSLDGRPEAQDVELVRAELLASPRRSYAGAATVVHPGPRLTAEDERAGLGPRGSATGGLAALLAGLGRFGLFGQFGSEPADGTVLPLLLLEERSGEHLGVPWRGAIAWCEGADLPSRAGRRGARIAGAALHEGYWIDVDAVRAELAAWDELARRFEGSPERVRRALAVGGLEAEVGPDGVRSRTATEALLGQAQRVRLAVLVDRAPAGLALGRLELDDLLAVTAAHEEGHLCDRTRFLPLARRWPAALALLADAGFSAARVHEELELRAQLTALCVAPDPRLALVQVLESAESGPGPTPHGAAYARLLADLLLILDARVAAGAQGVIDPTRTLAHQLHRLGPEELRAVAVDLARRKRMVVD
ncbi:MAG: hypothetical protein JNK02_15665 [Planctomycetes bacterium]|nr:hypothetical protein [Planctomycetota bacterium]